jgi:serine/threonine-protein kinase
MGEIYHADDLVLAQAVALKFLPEELRNDPGRLGRFYNEVRLARQITHPAVCRVHDVGQAEGLSFLSMEYVDGEDLASLLQRIGRLGEDKALEIARELCAGLAAAHDNQVLHRDLKPENVMIDHRGRVRITDFGLAGLVDTITGAEVRSGTPAYMSPEQLAGREVTVRSDLYALGLVLYELFTGRRAFGGRTLAELRQQHEEELPPAPTSLVDELDPAIERVVLRCLEKDPAKRPASARAVSAALPGGDPLAAALAAGETPSPELVAAAGRERSLKRRTAWTSLGLVLASLAGLPALVHREHLLRLGPPAKAPAVLEDRARELLGRLGHGQEPADRSTGYYVDAPYLRWLESNDRTRGRWDGLRGGDPPVVQFWYRQAPHPLRTVGLSGRVFLSDPPPLASGLATVRLDLRGRLVGLLVVPPQVESAPAPAPPPPDWKALLAEAWLDSETLRPASPEWTPPVFADARAAWEGRYPGRPDIPLRVEAAAYRGRPVYLAFRSPWTRAERMEPFTPTRSQRAGLALFALVLGALVATAGFLARKNMVQGRGDRRGAFRLAAFTFGVGLLAWALTAHHLADVREELSLVLRGVGSAVILPLLLWLFYLAVEPYVRRQWPRTVVSWQRLLAGGWSDPLVGQDLLVGTATGCLFALGLVGGVLLPGWLGGVPTGWGAGNLDTLLGLAEALGASLSILLGATISALSCVFLLVLLRLILRGEKAAAVAFGVLFGLIRLLLMQGLPLWLSLPLVAGMVAVITLVLLRYGLLACAVALFVTDQLLTFPLDPRLSTWMGKPTVFALAVVLALALHGFRSALRRSAT